MAGQIIGAAKASHEREHHAHRGRQADQESGGNHLFRAHLLVGEVGVQQGHGIGGQHFREGGPHLPPQGIGFRGQGQQGGEHQDGGEEAEDGGVRRRLGGAEYVVGERSHQGEAESFERPGHA